MRINYKFALAVIFLVTLAFRLYIAFTNTTFSSDDSYFNLRVTEYIVENKRPLLYDELSYSGRNIIYPQAFNYFLALFSYLPGYEKIIPTLLSSSIVLIVYLISKKLTNNTSASLFAALLSAFVPIEIRNSVNQISVYSLLIPIILLLILSLLNLENKKYFTLFIILSFILPLIHPISILFMLSLIFYLILANTESINLSRSKKEIIFFSFFVILLINFFLYKNALLRYGMDIIWQNIPSSLFAEYFQTFNILEVLYLLGVMPLILGIIGIYAGLFKRKDENILLLASFTLASLLLLSLKLINLQVGILFVSIPLLIASSKSLLSIYSYFNMTKIYKYKSYFDIALFILIILSSVIPSIYVALSLPNYNPEFNAFTWINKNTDLNSVVLAPVEVGNILTHVAKRKNIADTNFLLAPNVDERLDDINLLYNTVFKIKGIELIKKYSINYIYLPSTYPKIPYIGDENCFEVVVQNVYKVKC